MLKRKSRPKLTEAVKEAQWAIAAHDKDFSRYRPFCYHGPKVNESIPTGLKSKNSPPINRDPKDPRPIQGNIFLFQFDI